MPWSSRDGGAQVQNNEPDLAMENSTKGPIICSASLIWELLHLHCDFHPSLSQNALLTEAR